MSIDQLVNLLAAVTLIEMMITLGLGVKASDVFEVGKRHDLLFRAFLANYLIVPAAAVALLLAFHANPMVAAGFLVAAVCPGAPYAPPFTSMAKGNVNVSVGLMLLLAASSAVFAPVLLGFLLPILGRDTTATINVAKIVRTLLGAQLLPLCIGLWIRHNKAEFAQKLRRPASVLTLVLNLVLLTVIIAAQFHTLAEIRGRGYIGMFCLLLATLAAGWLVAKRGQSDVSKSMVLTTAVRNVGVSLVIATASFPGTAAITSATAYGIFQTIVVALLALAWGRYTPEIHLVQRKAA